MQRVAEITSLIHLKDKRKCVVERRIANVLGRELVGFIHQYAFNSGNIRSFILTVRVKYDFLYERVYKS